MMIEHEFSALFDREQALIRGPEANEVTRLAIDPGEGRERDKPKLLLLLLRGMYQWLTEQGIRYSYMVVEKRMHRMLRAIGFPCRAISPASALPPAQAISLAAVLDWEEFQEENARLRPSFLEWMSTPALPAESAEGSGRMPQEGAQSGMVDAPWNEDQVELAVTAGVPS
jgi:N-acyl-L-homoserine lactone synthetase